MFANPKFSRTKVPKFHDAFISDPERERSSIPFLKARISNDNSVPSRQLVAIDFYDIPEDAEGKLKNTYDYIYGVSLTPEDAIQFVRWLNRLLSELFNEDNYIRG
jgi:hypothetical protein